MQVNQTVNEGLKRGYSILVTADQLNSKVTEKLQQAQPEIELKGFRKGKAPIALLRKQYGQRLMGEAIQESIDNAMKQHFEDTGDRPAMNPEIKIANENWKEGDDVEVSIVYEALPEIPEVDFKNIKLEKMVAKPDNKAIEKAIKKLAENVLDYKERRKGSKARNGDQVTLDFLGRVDDVAFDGGAADDYPLVIGSNSFIPGFEEQLVGCKTDEEKTVKVTFPSDYGNKDLAGKDAVFQCKIKFIKEPIASEINDALAKNFGMEDLAAFKSQVSERLEKEYKEASRSIMKRKLLDILDKKVKFELPPSMVEVEAKQIAHQLRDDENPEAKGNDQGELKIEKEHKELAERRVKLGLLLAELGQKANVEVNEQEMMQAMMEQARQYPGKEKELLELMKKNEQLQQQIRAPLFEDKVVDYIFELSKITDKKVDEKAIQKALEELEKQDA